MSGDWSFWTRMMMMPMKSTKLICRRWMRQQFKRLMTSRGVSSHLSDVHTLIALTMIEASTGPLITHQMAALSFMSQHLHQRRRTVTFSCKEPFHTGAHKAGIKCWKNSDNFINCWLINSINPSGKSDYYMIIDLYELKRGMCPQTKWFQLYGH